MSRASVLLIFFLLTNINSGYTTASFGDQNTDENSTEFTEVGNENILPNSHSSSMAIEFSRYFGGSSSSTNWGSNTAVDSKGDVYLLTNTNSSDYPVYNALYKDYPAASTGGYSVGLSKFNKDGYLIWSTYIGSSDTTNARDIVVDSSDNIILTGFTWDTTTDYPTTVGVYQQTHAGAYDGFVTKINSQGDLIFSTLIGGTNDDFPHSVTVDSNDNILIGGDTNSMDYPLTTGGYDQTLVSREMFITKLSSDGSNIIWSTFLGGSDQQQFTSFEVDSTDDIFFTLYTVNSNYAISSNAFDATFNGPSDYILGKLKNDGSALLFSTYIGGSGSELLVYRNTLEVTDAGNVVLVLSTSSSDFPLTADAYGFSNNGNYDVALMKLNSTGFPIYSTYLGGDGDDHPSSLSLMDSDTLIVSGSTTSTNFPYATQGTDTFISMFRISTSTLVDTWSLASNSVIIDTKVSATGGVWLTGFTSSTNFNDTIGSTLNGGRDWFISKLNFPSPKPNLKFGSNIIYSRVFGGSDSELEWRPDFVRDNDGSIFVAGFTRSNDFPVMNGYDHSYNPTMGEVPVTGAPDIYAMKFNKDGYLLWSTYFGGTSDQYVGAIALDSNGNLGIVGWTSSVDFPITAGVYDTTISTIDSFFAKFSSSGNLLVSTYVGGTSEERAHSLVFDGNDNPIISGDKNSIDFASSQIYGPGGGTDFFIVKLNPTATAILFEISIGGSGTDYMGAIDVNSAGEIFFLSQVESTDLVGTAGAMNTSFIGGVRDLFIGKLFSNGTVAWATFLGSNGIESFQRGFFVDKADNLYVGGGTDGSNFPKMGIQLPSTGLNREGFVTKFDGDGQLLWSTLLGGSADDLVENLVITEDNEIVMISNTYSNDFPLVGPLDSSLNGTYDVVLSKFSMGGELLFSTLIGGDDKDEAYQLYNDGRNTVVIGGATYSNDFPTTMENTTPVTSTKANVFLMKYRHASLPDRINDLSVVHGDTQLTLNWSAPSHRGAQITNYAVYRSINELGTYTFLSNTTSTTFVDTTVINGQKYFYKVTAWNRLGENEGSNIQSETPSKVPTSPQNVSLLVASNSMTISWDASASSGGSAITGYKVYRSIASGGNYVLQITTTELTYIDTNITLGTKYFYVVTAENSIGESSYSNEVSGTPGSAPTPPTSLTATTGTYVLLNWSSPSDGGGYPITSYKVYRSIFSGGPYILISTTSAMYYEDSTTVYGTEYYYVVSAVNSAGESLFSNEVQITGTGSATNVPTSPQQLVAKGGDNSVILLWLPPQTQGGKNIIYIVYRGTISGNYNEITRTVATSFIDTNVTNGVKVFYVVSALNVKGESPRSNEVSLVPAGIPSAPTSLSATIGDMSVTLEWNAPFDEGGGSITGYKIYRSDEVQINFLLISTTTSLSFTDTNLQNGLRFKYVVTADSKVGESVFSNEVEILAGRISDSPQNLFADPGNNLVTLQWTRPPRDGGFIVEYYIVYRSTTSGLYSEALTTTTITSFIDSTAENGVKYYYVVTAVNSIGESIHSNEVSAEPVGPERATVTETSIPFMVLISPLLIIGGLQLIFRRRYNR